MKIIDLLNKIANGEEVPKIILFNSYKYRFDKIDRVYRNIMGNSTLGTINELDLYLNYEVEILEEEKKIPEKLNIINGAVDGKWENGSSYNYTLSAPQTVIIHKLNDVIDYLKSKGE